MSYRPGQTITSIPAKALNAALRLADAGTDRSGEMQVSSPTLRVRNDSGAAVPPGGILGIGGLVETTPPAGFIHKWPTFRGITPTGEHAERYVILKQGLGVGEIGACIASGIAVARISVADATHGYATVTIGSTLSLTSSLSGMARILWQEQISATLRWAVIRLGGGGGGTAEAGSATNPFLLPAGTTDVAQTTTWDMAYNQAGYTGVTVEAWNRTSWGGGSGAVYGFSRQPTFDSTGRLVAVGPEVRTVLWSVGDCSVVVPAPVIAGGSCLITNASSITVVWTPAPGGLPPLRGYRYRYGLSYESLGVWTETVNASATLSELAEGPYRMEIQQGYADDMWGPVSGANITVDMTPPVTPIFLSGHATITNAKRPTWSWTGEGSTSPGNAIIINPPCASTRGNNTYQVELDGISKGTYAYTLLTVPTWTPSVDLADGTHVLRVRERDAAGNWSEWASWTITVDTGAPTAPVVALAEGQVTPTALSPITWTWVSGGGGNGTFRYSLTGTGSWTETTNTNYSLAITTSGTRTLYVQERDAAGNWSSSGSCSIVVDKTPPYPVVMGVVESPTVNPRPTWTWTHNSAGSDGAGVYRYALDSTDLSGAAETTDTAWGPSSDLANGWHTLYVQERDALGNWSNLSGKSVLVTT